MILRKSIIISEFGNGTQYLLYSSTFLVVSIMIDKPLEHLTNTMRAARLSDDGAVHIELVIQGVENL
jgi:hypothetical protein